MKWISFTCRMQILQIMFLLFYMTAPRVQMCTQLKMEICFQMSTTFVLLHLNKAILVRRAEPLSSYLNWICYLYWTFTSVVIVEWSVQKTDFLSIQFQHLWSPSNTNYLSSVATLIPKIAWFVLTFICSTAMSQACTHMCTVHGWNYTFL